jgi:D-sedoheptulose 7-phosphate isomerase
VNHFATYTDDIKHSLDRLPFELLEEVVERLHVARMAEQQVFILGNGGSAATATHLACDLGKNTVVPNLPRFRVMALTDNISFLTALANDMGYENIFSEQLANFIKKNDVVIAISASGNSPNVLKAIQLAKSHHALTIGWSGYHGGELASLVDLPVVVLNHCIEQIEDIHMILAHMITRSVRLAAEKQTLAAQSQISMLLTYATKHEPEHVRANS